MHLVLLLLLLSFFFCFTFNTALTPFFVLIYSFFNFIIKLFTYTFSVLHPPHHAATPGGRCPRVSAGETFFFFKPFHLPKCTRCVLCIFFFLVWDRWDIESAQVASAIVRELFARFRYFFFFFAKRENLQTRRFIINTDETKQDGRVARESSCTSVASDSRGAMRCAI